MSPFKSYKQQAYLFAKEPAIAKKWAKKYGTKKKPDEPKKKEQKGGVLR